MTEHQAAPLLSGVQTVKSIRDTGYKGTDYAIAELIDNAVDAGAENITVTIVEEAKPSAQRVTRRVTEILVLDDGEGMGPERANLALSFGGSGEYDSRMNIGRFGMGLPQASVSQCRRTDLWSWQRSQPENAHHTSLDLDLIEASKGRDLTVPWPTEPGHPEHRSPPRWVLDLYRERHRTQMVAGQQASSGTVVRWTGLDRLRWVRASSVVDHTEFLLGRIYRRFIQDGGTHITIVTAERHEDGSVERQTERPVRSNDPMYVASPKDTHLGCWHKVDPAADDPTDTSQWLEIEDEPPFEEAQPPRRHDIPLPDGSGNTARITIRFSQAKPEARPGRNAGAHTHLGRENKHNRGISMMRLGREILLEQTLVTEPVDRWWGVEIDFPPDLDEVFGVTNNKQDTPYFTNALRFVLQSTKDPDEAQQEALFDEDDPVAALYKPAYEINQAVASMKQDSKRKQGSRRRNTSTTPARVSTIASHVNRKLSERTPTPGEREYKDADPSREQAADQLERSLRDEGLDEDSVKVVSNHYRQGVTVHFLDAGQSQSPAFFWTNEVFDDEQIYVNTEHPAYELLIEPLRLSGEDIQELSEDIAKKHLGQASDAMAMLLQSFARLELEVRNDPTAANYYQTVREQWGRRLREIIGYAPSLAEEIFGDLGDDE